MQSAIARAKYAAVLVFYRATTKRRHRTAQTIAARIDALDPATDPGALEEAAHVLVLDALPMPVALAYIRLSERAQAAVQAP